MLFSLSFGAIFLSFLPELLFRFGVSANSIWRLSSACLSLYSLLFLIWWFTRTSAVKKSNPEIFTWAVFWAVASAHILIVFVQFAYVFSIFDIADAAAFSLALIWYLVHSAHQFVRMLFIQPKDGL